MIRKGFLLSAVKILFESMNPFNNHGSETHNQNYAVIASKKISPFGLWNSIHYCIPIPDFTP